MGVEDANDPFLKIEGGIGYGRIIDATDLAKAMRLVEDLIKYRIVNREPSQRAYFELAEIITAESEYKDSYGPIEYEKYWFEALEEVLQRDGALSAGGFGSLGHLRAQEVLINIPLSSDRSHGALSKIGVGYVFSDYVDTDNDPSLDLSYEYALPRSTYKFQLVDRVDYSLEIGDFSHLLQNTLSLNYALSLRTDWENNWVIALTIPDEGEKVLTNDVTSTLKYYITNKIDLRTVFALSLIGDGVDDNGNDDLATSLSFKVTYQIK
jgi:hypothetical protein